MKSINLIEPFQLYNLLNQVNHGTPCVSNEYYLVLFDPRKLDEFTESHVVTSRYIKCDDSSDTFEIPKNIDYSAVRYLVVIDNRASSQKDVASPAIRLADKLWQMGSKFPVNVVKGGYEEFSALYPFLRSQQRILSQCEMENFSTYPIEIEPGFLYIGLRSQAMLPAVIKNLKVKAHINLTLQEDKVFAVDDTVYGKNRELVPQLLQIPSEDSLKSDLQTHFLTCCSFIDQHRRNDGKSVVIYSELGISRNVTIALCYLMHHHKISLKDALQRVQTCHFYVCPNQSFIKALLEWEVKLLGSQLTEPSDLGFLSYN